ncbi:TPA: histidine--tRNA ligase [Candidatus Saccharibacteria bacterium]|nr:histidine--tRNA ligase [Candidatus Saccharibacteria bacterium]
MNLMSSLSTAPYKGTRDYYPDDMRVRNYIFRTWERVCERYGYEEYATPLLEPIEVYAAKTGQEIVNEQTYSFTDRGDRTVAIRPEMTPSISRMVAARRQELAYPARLYNIANYMRYERPQRGREREFWQLNADVFGAEGPMADAEVIQIGVDIMKEFGAKDSMYTIKVNNRKIINAMMHDYLGLDAVQAELMIKLFDRKNKISNEEFRDQAIDIFGKEAAPAGLKKIAELLLAKDISKMPKEIADNESVQEVTELFELLETKGVKNLVFDITLMRGFDYYTGTVFEFFDTHPENNRAMFGGGRYDGLVGLFGAEPLSAVGMAPGLSTTELFLASHDLMPKFHSTTEIYIVVLGENTLPGATKLAAQLREEGVNTELDITGRKLDKQIKTAVKKQIPYMLFVGEEELRKELYNFKDTNTSSEEKLALPILVSKVKDRRKKSKDELDDFADL